MPRVLWPPRPRPKSFKKGLHHKVDGEPTWVWLKRFQYDHTLRGTLWNTCCGCGLQHLFTFEVVRQRNGEWWLIERAYRHDKPVKGRGKKK